MSILLSRARSEHCRWPICEAVEPRRGEPRGRRVCRAPASWPTSYCAVHRLRIYDRVPEIRVGSDFTTRRAPASLDRQPELTEIFR
jgi:hypothetical protein